MRPLRALTAALVLALALSCGDGGDGALATATIVVTGDGGSRAELTVELARTASERSRGLMFREELPEDRGMLFVYAEDTKSGFWMKDTSIALSIAFIAADGTILDVQEMAPLSRERHRPQQSYRYALEVNQGWFRRHGLGPGDRVEMPEGLKTPTAEGKVRIQS